MGPAILKDTQEHSSLALHGGISFYAKPYEGPSRSNPCGICLHWLGDLRYLILFPAAEEIVLRFLKRILAARWSEARFPTSLLRVARRQYPVSGRP